MTLEVATGALWHIGFRPTKVRVTYACGTPPMWQLAVGKLASGNDYGVQNNYVSGAEMSIVCTEKIERINLYGYCANFVVTKIEFYG
jgi:hypothetical protein